MEKTKKVRFFCLSSLLFAFFIVTSFQYPHGPYSGIHGVYQHKNEGVRPYPYTVRLTFSGNLLHRVEVDSETQIKVDKSYVGGSSTTDGTKTSYHEVNSNGTEILVGIQGQYITIDTKLEYGVFQNHIRWEKNH